jgi:RND superfamily putative drug exporter
MDFTLVYRSLRDGSKPVRGGGRCWQEVTRVFAAIGRFAYRRRAWVLAVWAVAFAAGLAGSIALPGVLKGGGFTRAESPSQQAQEVMRGRLGVGPTHITIVFASDELDARGRAFREAQDEVLARLVPEELPGLIQVETASSTGSSSMISRDGRAALAVLSFDSKLEPVQDQIPRVRELARSDILRTYVTGEAAVYRDVEEVSARDLRTAESYTVPIAVLVLLLIFGTLVAASLPVIGGGAAVTVTLGTFYVLAHFWDLSIFAMNSATLLGLAVGIDYALFMVGRFREELAAGRPTADAVEETVRHAGRAIFFSGLAVLVGLLGLMFIPYMSMRSIALGGSLVVFYSVLSALTLLPALLAALGPRVNALRIFYRPEREGRFWRRWSAWVMRHPWPVLVATVALVLVLAWPALRLEADVPGATSLPTTAESRRGYDILVREFDPSALSPIEVVVTWDGDPDPLAPANLERLAAFGAELAAWDGVSGVTSIVTLPGVETAEELGAYWETVLAEPSAEGGETGGDGTGGGDAGGVSLWQGLLGDQQREASRALLARTTGDGVALFRVAPEAPPASAAARELSTAIRDAPPPPGARIWVAGVPAGTYDYVHTLYSYFPWIVLFVLVVTGAVLLLLLRSALLPVKAVIVNTLSIAAAFGVMVWVFQDGNLEGLLRFDSSGAIEADLPILLFCSVFGISMDYEVFLLSRMRERWLETGDNRESVGYGLEKTGRIVTSAALIIVVVAGSFTFTSIVITKALGVGLAVAVALDATVIRILMVPAAMRLLGRWNWWLPDWVERRLP